MGVSVYAPTDDELLEIAQADPFPWVTDLLTLGIP